MSYDKAEAERLLEIADLEYRATEKYGHGLRAGTMRALADQLRAATASHRPVGRWSTAEPATAGDLAKREHARQMSAWENAQPARVVVTIDRDRSWYGTHKIMGFTVRATTPDQIRTAADELRALADWFEKRPATQRPDGDGEPFPDRAAPGDGGPLRVRRRAHEEPSTR
jgi:hypothetical protein